MIAACRFTKATIDILPSSPPPSTLHPQINPFSMRHSTRYRNAQYTTPHAPRHPHHPCPAQHSAPFIHNFLMPHFILTRPVSSTDTYVQAP